MRHGINPLLCRSRWFLLRLKRLLFLSLLLHPSNDGLPFFTAQVGFYTPVNAELYAGEEHDELPEELSGYDLVYYTDEITQALERQKMPEEAQRGIMCWYGENDSVDQKVESVFLNIECRERNVWCVAECQLKEPLTPAELETLKEYTEQ